MLTIDRLAGVKQILLFITEDTPMALQALAAVGEGVDGQAGAMDTPTAQEDRVRQRESEPREEDQWNLRKACYWTDFFLFPPPFFFLFLGFALRGGVCVFNHQAAQTYILPRLTYFQDRGRWSFGHRGAPAILPRIRR